MRGPLLAKTSARPVLVPSVSDVAMRLTPGRARGLAAWSSCYLVHGNATALFGPELGAPPTRSDQRVQPLQPQAQARDSAAWAAAADASLTPDPPRGRDAGGAPRRPAMQRRVDLLPVSLSRYDVTPSRARGGYSFGYSPKVT